MERTAHGTGLPILEKGSQIACLSVQESPLQAVAGLPLLFQGTDTGQIAFQGFFVVLF